eukprot:TRINITY_DN14634_c0_g1_i2.p1 TRINITY_DN14634_c0_g1~~TRINITY_DN14634_c0_g1_i2.p1  ORF type:complete len:593 (-),score=113.44 TRINITY_DN14634_c0_g1_i2:147-1925(-)
MEHPKEVPRKLKPGTVPREPRAVVPESPPKAVNNEIVEQSNSGSGGRAKRLYPVKPKERVFDEWAAVLQHQDEANREAANTEKLMLRERQQVYRMELESQLISAKERARLGIEKDRKLDRKSMLEQQDLTEANEKRGLLQEQEKKTKAQALMEENLRLKQRSMAMSKLQEEDENHSYIESLKRAQIEEQKRTEQEILNKQRMTKALQESYDLYENLKRQERQKEKDVSRLYDISHRERLLREEHERQRFFDHLKEKQLHNDEKAKLYKYFIQEKREDQLREDEKAQFRAMQERLAKEIDREQKEKEAKDSARTKVKHVLEEQLFHKMQLADLIKKQDRDYAQIVRQQAIEQENLEKRRREAERLERLRYKESLQQQIEASKKKRLFKDVMSEHERQVNQMDLSAYENMKADMHARVVGVKDSSEVRFSPSKVQSKMSPEKKGNYTASQHSFVGSPGFDPEITKKINAYGVGQPRNSKNNVLSTIASVNPSGRILEDAIKNMNDPSVAYMRHNSVNRAYGYSPGRDQKVFHREHANPSFNVGPVETSLTLDASQDSPLRVGGKSQLSSIHYTCLLYTSPSPRDLSTSRMPSSA